MTSHKPYSRSEVRYPRLVKVWLIKLSKITYLRWGKGRTPPLSGYTIVSFGFRRFCLACFTKETGSSTEFAEAAGKRNAGFSRFRVIQECKSNWLRIILQLALISSRFGSPVVDLLLVCHKERWLAKRHEIEPTLQWKWRKTYVIERASFSSIICWQYWPIWSLLDYPFKEYQEKRKDMRSFLRHSFILLL